MSNAETLGAVERVERLVAKSRLLGKVETLKQISDIVVANGTIEDIKKFLIDEGRRLGLPV